MTPVKQHVQTCRAQTLILWSCLSFSLFSLSSWLTFCFKVDTVSVRSDTIFVFIFTVSISVSRLDRRVLFSCWRVSIFDSIIPRSFDNAAPEKNIIKITIHAWAHRKMTLRILLMCCSACPVRHQCLHHSMLISKHKQFTGRLSNSDMKMTWNQF